MLDPKEIDHYFNADSEQQPAPQKQESSRHSHYVHVAKLLLPSIAAVLIGLLLIFPSLKKDIRDITLDITKPKAGELEKLHIENTVFYITDKDNRVNNFVASNIDETESGSKIIKLSKPEGIIPSNDELWTNLKALEGYYDQSNNVLKLEQEVELFYSEGMSVKTTQAFYDFASGKGYGDKPVKAQGFLGNLDSEGFEYANDTSVLAFTGHTTIVINEKNLQRKQ